ncbi:MAG: BREX-1 system adenine-specific DNA-methyltransferase PglX [Isosphaeraceae bacterium]
MDQAIRNRLRSVVTQCRRLLEESIAQQLQGRYDIYATGKKDEVKADEDVPVGHLSDEERQARQDILAHFKHIDSLVHRPKESLEQLIREIAFTHLNRLCAYKMMEVRDVYVGGQKFREAVSKGLKSQGFLFYLADHPEDEKRYNAGRQEEAYRHFLNWLGGTLSQEIGVLFSPTDPANRVYPPQRVLDEVLDLLNSEELKGIWSEDETIGWVYQYFTPKELRDEARKASQAPRNSYELAFRNQFFTPRYVVEFLTDNTLGRIWYEMQRGHTRLKDECRYLVRRPNEVFLKEGEQPPKDAAEGRDDPSQEELLKLPVHIPHRSKKDPRDLKILDPACGSAHFLLYCFALLLVIYEEAYDDADLEPALKADYPTKDDLRRAVPGLILRHNLHGIDIDLRCTQIAALALWLRCQRAYQEMGLKKDRPRITKSNIVCAEPMPGEGHILREFVTQIEPRLLGQLVEVVFDKMKLAGEAGSLLKIEEEIRDAVSEARRQWRIGPVATQMRLFGEQETVQQQQRFDLSGITDAQFFEQAEAKVVNALRSYAEQAQNGQRFQRQLFAEDAVRGFAFVDICHKRFDVVLMNPPFGDFSKPSKGLVEKQYPRSKNDVYATFVERGIDRLNQKGLLGSITSRTGFFLSSFQRWRKEILLREAMPTVFADLGSGVLDTAMVETAAYCLTKTHEDKVTTFFRLLQAQNKEAALQCIVDKCKRNQVATEVFLVNPKSFDRVPGSPFAYWVSEHVLKTFVNLPSFKEHGRDVLVGGQTSDDFRFLKLYWEVAYNSSKKWVPFYKGGENAPYYDETRLVVAWDAERSTFDEFYGRIGRSNIRPSNFDKFFRAGLAYPYLPHRKGHFSHVPPGGVFGHASPMIQLPRELHWETCAIVNSSAYIGLLHLLMARGTSGGQTLKYEVGYVAAVPIPSLEGDIAARLRAIAEASYSTARYKASIHETSHVFHLPALLHEQGRSLAERSMAWQIHVDSTRRRLDLNQREIDDIAFILYGLDGEDRRLIEQGVCADQENDDSEDADAEEGGEDPTPVTGHQPLVAELISYNVGCALGRWDIRFATGERPTPVLPGPFDPVPVSSPGRLQGPGNLHDTQVPAGYSLPINWDGILVDDSDHPDDIIRRVRDVLEVIWRDRADAIEKEACEILGVAELRDYFRKPGTGGFWDDHVKRYTKSRRKAPIYWLLQSSKKNYALWIYYHRLDKDILFKALLNYVEPKIRREEVRLDELRSQKTALGSAAKGAKKLDKDIDRQEAFLSELRDFEDKLRRAANHHLDPDLNDGVVLNIAPLRELVPWKEAKSYWDDLMDGKYEWSSIGRQLHEMRLVE